MLSEDITVCVKPLLKADGAQEAGGGEVWEEVCHEDQAKKEDSEGYWIL